jgi:hypothetical protein
MTPTVQRSLRVEHEIRAPEADRASLGVVAEVEIEEARQEEELEFGGSGV